MVKQNNAKLKKKPKINPKNKIVDSASQKYFSLLQKVESPNVTFVDEGFPIFIDKAKKNTVWDLAGNKYLDLTAFFGVANFGHNHPQIKKAVSRQLAQCVHAMGDVHPSVKKVQLLHELQKMLPFVDKKSFTGLLGCNGADAIEAGIKTALLATKRPYVMSLYGGYHGLNFGPLALNSLDVFKSGFEHWTCKNTQIIPFPVDPVQLKSNWVGAGCLELSKLCHDYHLAPWEHVLESAKKILQKKQTAVVVLELFQGRGGEREVPPLFVTHLQKLAHHYGTLLMVDEIFTGFGRTGELLACSYLPTSPDILCLGKALGGGFPLSVCLSKHHQVWGKSMGEARHTYTFLGHPVSCAAGVEVVTQLVPQLSAYKPHLQAFEQSLSVFVEDYMCNSLLCQKLPFIVTGKGFMRGLWFYAQPPDFVYTVTKQMLKRGYIILPSGTHGNVLGISPPFTVHKSEYKRFFKDLREVLQLA